MFEIHCFRQLHISTKLNTRIIVANE